MAADPPLMTALRAHRSVVYAVVAAAVAVAFCALVAVAWMLGLIPPQAPGTPAPRTEVTAPEALSPGETLVSPADGAKRPEPLMPTYSQPAAPRPAPAAAPEPTAPAPARQAEKPAANPYRPGTINPDAPSTSPTDPLRVGKREPYRPLEASQPGPTTPSFSRRERSLDAPPAAVASRTPAACDDCGVVSSITTYPGRWDVRVRLESGGAQTFRFRSLPPYRIGDRVRVEGSRLLYD